jgi:hypothetical protein
MRILFLIIIGPLPLWAALCLIGWAYATMPAYQAGHTMWAILPALPACGVSGMLAIATVCLYDRLKGSNARRLGLAGLFFAAVVATLALYGAKLASDKRRDAETARTERDEVLQFVRANAQIRALAGASMEVYSSSVKVSSGATLPLAYDVSVKGDHPLEVLIRVNRAAEPPTFEFQCFTMPGTGRAPVGGAGCEQYAR